MDASSKIFRVWSSTAARASWYRPDQEQLVVFCLDARLVLKSFCLISIGSVNETLAHAREIFRPAIVDAAFAIIVGHNHPSGDPSPSDVDMDLARRLYSAADLLQIRFLDFIIIGATRHFSMVESSDWPPSEKCSSLAQRDLSDSHYSRNVKGRIRTIHATERQWRAMLEKSSTTGRLTAFLENATRHQLKRLRNLTPLFFDGAVPPGYYICARDFRPTDTFDWQLAKSYRALVAGMLRRSRIGT